MLRAFALVTAIVGGGCEVAKSSNPLSATVAGPIPGVNITTPKPLEPGTGQKIAVDKQPITLLLENAATNGVRPLYYTFEIATDANFANKVFTKEKTQPGTAGRTSLKLPDSLATGRTVFLARHGAGRREQRFHTAAVSFEIFTPIVIEAPVLQLPAGKFDRRQHPAEVRGPQRPAIGTGWCDQLLPGSERQLLVRHPRRRMDVRRTNWPDGVRPADRSRLRQDLLLAHARVRPDDQRTVVASPRVHDSQRTAGRHPAGGGGPGGPTGPVAGDAFDVRSAAIHASPAAVVTWPVTTTITSLSVRPDGVAVEFSKKSGPGRWPDVVPRAGAVRCNTRSGSR